MDNLQRTARLASNLHAKLSGWLTSSSHVHDYSVRRCWDPQLVLSTVPSIEDNLVAAGLSSKASRCISDLFLASSANLARAIVDEYKAALQATWESHEFCSLGGTASAMCPQSQSIAAAFTRLYERQVQSLLNDVVDRASSQANALPREVDRLSAFVTDYTPILEFAYAQSKKPNPQEKILLAQATGLELKQVNIWFQNRRARDKAGSFSKRKPPRTIDELGQRLMAHSQRHAVALHKRSNSESSNNDSIDSGYMPEYLRSTSVFSVDDLAQMLENFHIDDDDNKTRHVAKPFQSPGMHQMRPSRRAASSSEGGSIRGPIKRRPVSSRTKRGTTESVPPPYPPPEGAGRRAMGRPAFRSTRRVAFANERDFSTLTGLSVAFPVAAAADETILSTLPYTPSSSAEAVSANKAHPRKRVPLAPRRPACRPVGIVRDPSPERCPSLSWSTSTTPRSSSLSSQMSPSIPVGDLPCADQLYYRNPSTGEFIPVAGGSVIFTNAEPDQQSSSVLEGEVVQSVEDTIVFATPAELQFAPDHDPRAFSSNLLQESLSHAVSTFQDPPPFFCSLSGLSGTANATTVSADDASPPTPLQPVAATFSFKDLWAQPAGLDMVVSHHTTIR